MNTPAPPFSSPGQAADAPSLPAALLRLIRGRYVLAAVLGALGAAAGGAAGYLLVTTTYRSTAILQFSPSETAILYATPEDRRMTDFEGYMDAQLIYLRGEEVASAAMRSPIWTQADPAGEPITPARFQASIEASRAKGKQIVTVQFEHSEQPLALAGVRAVVRAFQARYDQENLSDISRRRERIEAELAEQNAKLAGLQDRERSIAANMEAVDLDQLIASKLAQLAGLEQSLLDLRAEPLAQPGGDAAEALLPSEAADAELASNLRLLQRVELELLEANHMGANHPEVKRLSDLKRRIEQAVDQRRRDLTFQGGVRMGIDPATAAGAGDPTPAREASLLQLKGTLDHELAELRRQREALRSVASDVSATREVIATARDKLHQLDVESRRQSRLTVVNDGGPPNRRHMGKRQLQSAAMGAAGGGAAGLGVVMLLGYLDRRVRAFEDVRDDLPGQRVLGMVPNLDAPHGSDLEESTLSAAMAIHEIRSQLQKGADPGRGQLILFTSASPGAGKTTLSMALAMSFGHCGSRTLLIDFDFVGHGVSSRLHPQPTGDDPAEDAPPGGVIDVLEGVPLEACCRPAAGANLWSLPVGDASIQDVGQLSRDKIAALLAQARQAFDTVIIDTGPMLGSIECTLTMPLVDDVILVVARGESRQDTLLALAKAKAYIPGLTGVIYNLADNHEKAYRTSVTSRMSQADRRLTTSTPSAQPSPEARRYGPVAVATATYMPTARNRAAAARTPAGVNGKNGHHGPGNGDTTPL